MMMGSRGRRAVTRGGATFFGAMAATSSRSRWRRRKTKSLSHDDQTTGSDDVIEQITKHLNRLIEVSEGGGPDRGIAYTERELMMVSARRGQEREEMKRMADIFRGRIIDVTDKNYTVELTGDQSRTTPSCRPSTARPSHLETVRTGASGIDRGERILRVWDNPHFPFSPFP